jgi:hypothetical protein
MRGFSCQVSDNTGEKHNATYFFDTHARHGRLQSDSSDKHIPTDVRSATPRLVAMATQVEDSVIRTSVQEKIPYLELNREANRLPRTHEIQFVFPPLPINESTHMVEMDEYAVTVVHPQLSRWRSIATHGVGGCVAIAARGRTSMGQPVIGLAHWSGAFTTANEALSDLTNEMRHRGATSTETFLVGGFKAPESAESGSLDNQRALMASRSNPAFGIVGAKLNVSELELDQTLKEIDSDRSSIDVLITPSGLFCSRPG